MSEANGDGSPESLRVVEHYRTKSMREISDITGLSYSQVRCRILAVGGQLRTMSAAVKLAKKKKTTQAEDDLIVRLYVGGASIPVVAREMKVSRTTVWGRLEERGVPRRPKYLKL